MREYKFRGMDINGNWYYGLLAHTENKKVCHDTGWFICNSEGSPFAYQIRPETIGQFTGLKDKNGKDDYEYDIIRDTRNGDVRIIEYHYGSFWAIRIKPKQDESDMVLLSDCNATSEIIGNKFNNPELLTNDKL